MYTADRRQRKHRTLLKFLLFVVLLLLIIGFAAWFFLYRQSERSSTNFVKAGAQIAIVKPITQVHNNELFKVSLPSGWEALGKKTPLSTEVYYEYQSKVKDADNRWLRVYVDVFPRDFPLNRLMPVSVVNNKIIPGMISDDCTSFTGAPLSGAGGARTASTWTAKWQGVDFVCDMARPRNYTGTSSQDEGNATTIVSKNGTKHQYFFVYIDFNVRPEYQILTDALKSFETL